MLPLLSIIVPIYNAEDTLPKCLDSIIKQTYSDFELICVNDASNDGSASILKTYAQKDKRIRIIEIKKSGQGFARNTALKIAKGSFIGFVDADDSIKPFMFEMLVKNATNHQADISMCFTQPIDYKTHNFVAFKYYDNEYRKLKTKKNLMIYLPQEIIRLLPSISLVPWNKIYRKDFLDKHHILFYEGCIHEDIPFSLTALLNTNKLVLTNKKLYLYTTNRPYSTMNCLQYENKHDIFEIIKYTKQIIKNKLIDSHTKIAFDTFVSKQFLRSLNDIYHSKGLSESQKKVFFNRVVENLKDKYPKSLNLHEMIQFWTVKKNHHALFLLFLPKKAIDYFYYFLWVMGLFVKGLYTKLSKKK